MQSVNEDKIKFEVENKDTNISKYYPDRPLTSRGKLAFDWLPENSERILDGGCSYGYTTKYFSRKSTMTFGIDLDPLHIEAAKSKYPEINFSVRSIESTGFDSNTFDAVILTDVLEHTSDKIASLNEIYRILKSGGVFIVTTPHKGLFGFMDPYNYGYYFRKYLPFIYKGIYKFVRLLKEGKIPKGYNPIHNEKHYHYSLNDFRRMLGSSEFRGRYTIEKVFRSGLFLEPLALNMDSFLSVIFGKSVIDKLIFPFNYLSALDYSINYGPLAYNIALKVKKA